MGFLLYHKLSRTWEVQANRTIGDRTAYALFWNITPLNGLPSSLAALPQLCSLGQTTIEQGPCLGAEHQCEGLPISWRECMLSGILGYWPKGATGRMSSGVGVGLQEKRAGLMERRAGFRVPPARHMPEVDVGRWEKAGTLVQGVRTHHFHLACVIFMHTMNSDLPLKTWTF